MKKLLVSTVGLVALACVPLSAHHSFAAEYDTSKPLTIEGVVTKFDFVNPHGWIYLDVKDETGKISPWAAEMGNVNALMRRGWSKRSLKPGDDVIISGFRAKDASFNINARSVKLPDGREMLAGSSASDSK